MTVGDLLFCKDRPSELNPEILEAQFPRIHYGDLARSLGLRVYIDYDVSLDKRVTAHLVGGTMVSSQTFVFRGEVVYLLDGELAAFSWKNCGNCPTKIAFFSMDMATKLRTLVIEATSPQLADVQIIGLNSPFEPRR